MPNRIIKESICTSDSIDTLSWFEEVVFYRLIVNCDDYGRFDGRVTVIKNRLFPLKDGVTTKSVKAAIDKLVTAGLVALYEYEGKPYLHLPTWDCHQQMRAKRSKYPSPEDGVKSSDINCNHEIPDAPVIQSESESESESECERKTRARARFAPPAIAEVEEFFRMNDGNVVQATRFHAYYESNGWRVGKNPMKSWEAAARGWISRDKETATGGTSRAQAAQKSQDIMMRYSAQERQKTISAAVVEFD